MILLVGPNTDPPLRAVAGALKCMGVDFTCVDDDVICSQVWSPGCEPVLRANDRHVSLECVRSAYLRPGKLVIGHSEQRRAMDAIFAWADLSDAAIINPPMASSVNNSKALQSQMISRYGFRIPECLVTTDPSAARDFALLHGAVVYKSISGIRSIVRKLSRERVNELENVRNSPTLFQRYIAGDELRIHVIGEFVHALLIESDADDYRYPSGKGQQFRVSEIELSCATADSFRDMAQAMGLLMAGIDVRRTESGDLYCLEVNPSPAFTYYEQLAGIDFATQVAVLLIGSNALTIGRVRPSLPEERIAPPPLHVVNTSSNP